MHKGSLSLSIVFAATKSRIARVKRYDFIRMVDRVISLMQKQYLVEKSNFVDQIRVFCKSGHGGAGIRHFRRDKLTAMGGPDGGDGGRGGHIILKGNRNLWTLLHLRYYKNVIAENGEGGSGNNCSGRSGKDVYIDVPLGTIARDEVTGQQEAEILEDGQEFVWLKGGRGGLGN